MHKLFTVCIEQMRSPYTEHAASGLPNPTHLEGEVRFVQAQYQQVVTRRSPRVNMVFTRQFSQSSRELIQRTALFVRFFCISYEQNYNMRFICLSCEQLNICVSFAYPTSSNICAFRLLILRIIYRILHEYSYMYIIEFIKRVGVKALQLQFSPDGFNK